MMILPYLLLGLVGTAVLILLVCMVFSVAAISSWDKDLEDEEQMKWLKEYRDKKLAKGYYW